MHGQFPVYRRDRISLFPEAKFNNNLVSGFNRAKLAWYVIDPLFLRNGSSTRGVYQGQHPDDTIEPFCTGRYMKMKFSY
jgi:hypothetical protein